MGDLGRPTAMDSQLLVPLFAQKFSLRDETALAAMATMVHQMACSVVKCCNMWYVVPSFVVAFPTWEVHTAVSMYMYVCTCVYMYAGMQVS